MADYEYVCKQRIKSIRLNRVTVSEIYEGIKIRRYAEERQKYLIKSDSLKAVRKMCLFTTDRIRVEKTIWYISTMDKGSW